MRKVLVLLLSVALVCCLQSGCATAMLMKKIEDAELAADSPSPLWYGGMLVTVPFDVITSPIQFVAMWLIVDSASQYW